MKTYIFLTGANSFLGKAVQKELKQLVKKVEKKTKIETK